MDEVKQRVQLEAIVIGFSLTVMLIMLLFLICLCDVPNPDLFNFANMVAFCWAFYFIGWIVTKKKVQGMKNTIKVERAKKNWTQADLAKHIGISKHGLNAIETAKFILSTVLAPRMAKVFNTTVEVLFQLDDTEE